MMTKIIRIVGFTVLVSIISILVFIPSAQAETLTSSDVTMSGGTITSYSGSYSEVIIPQTIGGVTVTGIANSVFRDKSEIISVSLPNTLSAIGEYAFSGCSIETLSLGTGVVTIGDYSFQNNTIDDLIIPNSCTTIGYSAFYNNDLLTLSLGTGVEIINNTAFASNKITDVTIPDSCQSIGWSAFQASEVVNLDLGSGVAEIGRSAFYANWIETLSIPNSCTTIEYRAFGNNKITTLDLGIGVETMGESAFIYNDITSISIPNSCIEIGYSCFASNEIASVTFGTGLQSLPYRAFKDNAPLTSISIPASCESLGSQFIAGTGIRHLTVPSTVLSLEAAVFGATRLDSVTFDSDFAASRAQFEELSYTPVVYGYTFLEYYEDSSFTTPISDSTFASSGDVTVYYAWDLVPYSIIYSVGTNGINNAGNPAEYTIEDTVTFLDPSREHYIFSGWYQTSTYVAGSEITGLDEGNYGTKIVYAKWELAPVALEYNANDANGTMDNESYLPDTEFSLAACTYTKDYYNFTGWNTEQNGSGTPYSDEASFTMPFGGDILYAQWLLNADYNTDGVIDILDLSECAQHYGEASAEYDVNENGQVNIFDLVMIAGEMAAAE